MKDDPSRQRAASELTSTTLIEQLKSGDGDSWSFFIFVYRPLILRWALRFGVPEDDANDVAQDVVSSVLDSLKSFHKGERDGSFRKWLKTITYRRTMDFLNKRGIVAEGGTSAHNEISQIPNVDEDTTTFLPEDDRSIELQRALEYWKSKVKPHTYQAFHRVVNENQEPQRVADDLGIDIQVVYQACSRMLRRLRQYLGDDFRKA